MSKLYENNRKRFGKLMDDNSVLVIFAGTPPLKRGDEFHIHSPQRNFLYLTGLDSPHLVFMMYKDSKGNITERLYLERFDEAAAKWVGEVLGREEAENLSGVKAYAYIDEYKAHIAGLFSRYGIKKLYCDMENRSYSGPLTPDLEFARETAVYFPGVKIENAYPLLAKLRAVKSKEEIRCMRKAVDITKEGFYEMLKHTRPGMMEYEVEAYFDYMVKKSGCKDKAFATILASGKNATVLHYSQNNSKIEDGDLVLVDFGAQYNYYSADVTRTFPANGQFTERQKQIYNIVLGGNLKIIETVKPGLAFGELNETLKAYYVKELKKIGLIEKREDLSEYYYHGVSHMLGLETHDIGRGGEGKLEKGMVFTVEPGLYIAEENIGIRIEDDVLVTEDGCEVLTSGIIKTAEEIEEFMAKRPSRALGKGKTPKSPGVRSRKISGEGGGDEE